MSAHRALPCRARCACPSRPVVALRSARRRRRSARRKRQRQLGPPAPALATAASASAKRKRQRQRQRLNPPPAPALAAANATPPPPPPSLSQLLPWKGGRCGGGECDQPAARPSLPSSSLHCSACCCVGGGGERGVGGMRAVKGGRQSVVDEAAPHL
ncbi:unnamed protein product [Closterium sp. NIES-54]